MSIQIASSGGNAGTSPQIISITKETLSSESRCSRWSLGKDVESNPPLLEDMGLCPLSEWDSESSTYSYNEVSKVLPTPVFIQQEKTSEEFFVFKRRKLDAIAGEDKINKLTEEVLLMIFKWLPKFMLVRCAQVCRRWKRLAFDESLWRRLDLGSKTLNPGVVGRVLLRGTFTLRLAKAEISSPIFYPQLKYLPGYPHISCRIQNLDLSMAAISPEDLCELFSVCFDLRKVSLEHCTLTEECCIHLSNNSELDTLNLAMCYGLSTDGLVSILTCCPKLQALNLAWTNLSEKAIMDVCENLPPSLLRLNLSGCRHTLTDSHVKQLVQSTPSLLELDLSDATQITSTSVNIIIKRLSRLEYLALARCFCITPSCYLGLVAMRNLLYLDVYGALNEKALITVKEQLPDIKINNYFFSSVARPTVGIRRTSIWGLRVRD